MINSFCWFYFSIQTNFKMSAKVGYSNRMNLNLQLFAQFFFIFKVQEKLLKLLKRKSIVYVECVWPMNCGNLFTQFYYRNRKSKYYFLFQIKSKTKNLEYLIKKKFSSCLILLINSACLLTARQLNNETVFRIRFLIRPFISCVFSLRYNRHLNSLLLSVYHLRHIINQITKKHTNVKLSNKYWLQVNWNYIKL